MTSRADAHGPEFHRKTAHPQPVRCATTANITISTALNNGDTLDGLTLATGDRVLVKDQSTGAENGIYEVGVSPARAYDMDDGLEALGAIVYVITGTANGGKAFKNTNATLPTIGATALTFTEFGASGGSVTSVALTVPAEFSVSGSPITTSGTLAVTKANESANTIWAGPTSGSAAQPAFRALVAADIPAGIGPTDHEHIDNVMFSGDGSTTAFELPAAPFDGYAVQAFVAGVRVPQTLSGTMLTTMTFDTAPASGTDNIVVDIVAVAA